uniref:Uncharacterized protein n=1 Tax=Candidatus Kentrum eta TaxID=2126337 RepID=A0A450UJ74_9GAMM|nr:MAG: hypothetical protein BECKH772A_GA0070896_100458 [Candidatus Kentron sp. H]VFJ93472.1 MAG: hypothetical protein BECKH772B_GA0070898_100459 [Candidatus Kentron sp. H]VFK00253.1 MAG: hypothetical protein BECKH772C_GA0070978_100429 [Candidatus Kentron sp. H]
MAKKKNLSNPFSTGGGGAHFEAHVQASFVALMLTGGHAPCLPCWPIAEIKLQGKIDGFDTDDLIVFVENPSNKERRKLLGQVKHSIAITQGSALFGEVMRAAWNDFNNPRVFTKGKDVIALMTGPLSTRDAETAWLLNHARANPNDPDRFFRNVETAKFSSNVKREKLKVLRYHLGIANKEIEVDAAAFHGFLKHFYCLGYDLGEEEGVVLSLINSHIAQFESEPRRFVWSRILKFTSNRNHHAGRITRNDLPEDLLEAFQPKAVTEIPEAFKAVRETPRTDWARHPDATYLALAILIGAWNEKKSDVEVISRWLGIGYDDWLTKAREILHSPDSPLSLKNGVWKVVDRAELWELLGSRILDQNLDTFSSLAVTVLKEPDPAFDLPTEKRYAADIHGKVLEHSPVLRTGIAEGLAILGSRPDACSHCSQGKAEMISVLAVRELFANADWLLWGSLNHLLPTLAEAAPGEFLDAVEKALRLNPCPFDELFAQEDNGVFGENYLTGLLWALEGLAWDSQYLVRVCVVLGELASHDPGGQWANRPANSLATILLPWLPQTLASVDKRQVAVRTLLNEWPDIAWRLIIELLPGQLQSSSGSHKPNWRRTIPDDWEKGVTNQEYWQQASFYAGLAVGAAGHDTARLSQLINHFHNLPEPAFDRLLEVLASQTIAELPKAQQQLLWDHLTKFTNQHRRFSDEEWALPDEPITRIKKVAEQLAPSNPFNRYQYLFTDNDFDLYEEKGNWEAQRKRLNAQREAAIREIFRQYGIEGVIRFAEAVARPGQVGQALGVMTDGMIEQTLLPHFLDAEDNKRKALAGEFLWRRHHISGWAWCDNLDRSEWTLRQMGQFLACLPFTKAAWDRASQWLEGNQGEYWSRAAVNPYQADGGLAMAIEKLMEHGRPHAAIDCLDGMRHDKQPIDVDQCVRALLDGLSSSEPAYAMDRYHIIELIKFLQSDPSVAQEDLFKVEWNYLPLLDGHRGAAPKLLEGRLAGDPEFFCEAIRLIYRSKKEDQPSKEPTEQSKAIATNAFRLLREWKIPPGSQEDETFSAEHFNEWLQRVKALCAESGHPEVALVHIGEVLIHAPSDPDGLWIHRAVATALNDRDAEDMCRGFWTGTHNARGAYWVDPTGKPEKELAEQFRGKAEEVENAGFQRFSVTLRDLAESYERDAKRIIDEHKERDDD